MRQFLQTILKFSIVPIIIVILIVGGFFVFDPMRVLYSYDSYSHTNANRDYYGLEMFKKNNPKYHYDSFIFGSSRTLAYNPSSWINYLPKGSSPYMMDGFGEEIYGMYHKVKYLDSIEVDIKNALIILDVGGVFHRDDIRSDMYFFLKHPDIDNSSRSDFYKKQFEDYLNPNYIASYYLNKFFGLKNKYIYTYQGNIRASVDSVTNELRREDLEQEIRTNSNYYKNPIFDYQISDSVVIINPTISELHKQWLLEIRSIFDKDKTDYKIVIGPMYFRTKFSNADLTILVNIFGSDRVYDFSGVNDFTTNKRNYYETSHYRPLVGDSIMHYIYTHPGNVEIQ